MNRHYTPDKVAVVCLFGLAMLTGCGDGGTRVSPPPAPPPPIKAQPMPKNLRILYRVLVNGNDRMTTFGPTERTWYPLEGQIYYVADKSSNVVTTLNRLINVNGTDHADAITNVTGYSQDEVLGFPWSTATLPGTVPLLEALNSNTGDNALVFPSENLAGYSAHPLAAYGYPRFGNAPEVLLTLSAGGVTVQSNLVAGGAVWRWFWNGVQFVNHTDYGREIQADFSYGTNAELNPTEAGDQLTYNFLDPSIKHGSPVVQFQNQGTTQTTRAVPLNWDTSFSGGDQDHPAIWEGMLLGKDLTLNFNNLGPVAKYTTHMTLPASSLGGLAMPIGYMPSAFNRFWTYDAASKALKEVTSVIPDGCSALPPSPVYVFRANFGGVILSDATATNAMGVYGVSPGQGGSVSFWQMFKFLCWGDGSSETASDTSAWSACYGNGNDVLFPAGDSTYNIYIITDSVQNVTARMDDLFQAGVR
jgi:hypothetical protein